MAVVKFENQDMPSSPFWLPNGDGTFTNHPLTTSDLNYVEFNLDPEVAKPAIHVYCVEKRAFDTRSAGTSINVDQARELYDNLGKWLAENG